MAARLSLNVILWIPVRIEDNDSVGSSQVDAEAAGARAQQEDELIRVGFGETIDSGLKMISGEKEKQKQKERERMTERKNGEGVTLILSHLSQAQSLFLSIYLALSLSLSLSKAH